MLGIELDIFHHTKATKEKDAQGLPWILSECDIKPMMFYNINAIGEYTDDDDSKYSSVYANGDVWNCMLEYDQLKMKLDEWRTYANTPS